MVKITKLKDQFRQSNIQLIRISEKQNKENREDIIKELVIKRAITEGHEYLV